MSFDTYYDNHPWADIATNQRNWYDPILREVYLRERQYLNFVSTQFKLAGPGSPVTQSMTITSVIPPHANFDPIGLRQLWMPSSYVDSFAREIVFSRYGGKLALHEFDNLITYWKSNGQAGLRPIVDRYIGVDMMEQMEMIARNTMLGNSYAYYAGGATNFNTIDAWADHKMTTGTVEAINLGFKERGVPFTTDPSGGPVGGGKIVCITSPGVIHDLRTEASSSGNENAFIDVVKYADGMRVIKGEIGIYKGVRFVETPRAILYNSGPISVQAEVTVAINAGDGAWVSKVEGVRQVGQSAATHTLTLDDTTGLAVNDIVAIHTSRTNAFGVTNGVDHRSGELHYRRIVAIPTAGAGGTIALDMPIMVDMNTDLGSGVYAYVTKGRHIHTSTFVGGLDGVVMGVGLPPRLHTPKPVDDFESMYRVSWDGYFGMQIFEPEVFEVVFSSGSNRHKGAMVQ